MSRLFLLFFIFFSHAVTAAAWSKSPTGLFHQSPLQQLSLRRTRSNEQSLALDSSSSKLTAVSGRDRGDGGGDGNRGEIPGGSPLRFCDESRDTDLYAIDYIELQPFPLYM